MPAQWNANLEARVVHHPFLWTLMAHELFFLFRRGGHCVRWMQFQNETKKKKTNILFSDWLLFYWPISTSQSFGRVIPLDCYFIGGTPFSRRFRFFFSNRSFTFFLAENVVCSVLTLALMGRVFC